MSKYITADEFINSAYGEAFAPSGSIFATSGEIDEFVGYVSDLVDLYCGRKFGPERYTQIVQSDNKDFLYVNYIPATGIVSLTYFDPRSFSTGSIASADYYLEGKTGKVFLKCRMHRHYTYTITYDAGFDVIPEPIKLATKMWANIMAQAIDNEAVSVPDGALTQFRWNKFQESYTDPRHRKLDSDIPPTVESILKRYRYLKG